MWRYLAGGLAAIAMMAAGMLWFGASARPEAVLSAAPPPAATPAGQDAPLPDTVPEASPRTREQKRFDRYDKDRDGRVTRDEYLAARRKAFARLDTDGDGRLSFDEWAIKATTKFAAADRDRSGAMNAAEFATTAVKRRAQPRPKCPPATPAAPDDDG